MTNHFNVQANSVYTEGRRDAEKGIFKSPKKHVEQDPNFIKAMQKYLKQPKTKKETTRCDQIRSCV